MEKDKTVYWKCCRKNCEKATNGVKMNAMEWNEHDDMHLKELLAGQARTLTEKIIDQLHLNRGNW
jgi:hypothetical protein